MSQSASQVSVGVTIHDLDALDRQVLGQAQQRSSAGPQRPARPGSADYAYEALRTANSPGTDPAKSRNSAAAAPVPIAPGSGRTQESGPAVERLLKLAQTAESNGKRELALAYLRSARDSGSPLASQEIERLSATRKSPR